MAKNLLYFVGSFHDQPTRILRYATAARSLGWSPQFVEVLADVPDYAATGDKAAFVFTDEVAIASAYDFLADGRLETHSGLTISSLVQLTDKFRSRQLSSKWFPHPHFLIQVPEEIEERLPLQGSWLSKPRWGSNSRDVQKFENACSFRASVMPILERKNQALVEKYIEGRHICVDFAWSGDKLNMIGYCEKCMMSFSRKIVEAFHTLEPSTSVYANQIQEKLQDMISKHFAGVNFVIHGEFIVEEATEDCYIAELNPRAPWGLLPELFSFAQGVNFDELVVANAVGEPVDVSLDYHPVVLGAVFCEEFFTDYEKLPSRGNTVFIERFDASVTSERGADSLTKFGRYIVWGEDTEAVRSDWEDLSQVALPKHIRESTEISTASTWKSKCC